MTPGTKFGGFYQLGNSKCRTQNLGGFFCMYRTWVLGDGMLWNAVDPEEGKNPYAAWRNLLQLGKNSFLTPEAFGLLPGETVCGVKNGALYLKC